MPALPGFSQVLHSRHESTNPLITIDRTMSTPTRDTDARVFGSEALYQRRCRFRSSFNTVVGP
eukprot:1390110-Pyramimonas_sp.AAC.1